MGRSGFARSLGFGALAAVSLPLFQIVSGPWIGASTGLSLYFVAAAAGYAGVVAPNRSNAGRAAAFVAAAGLALLVLGLPPRELAMACAALLGVARCAVSYRAPGWRGPLLEAALFAGGLALAGWLESGTVSSLVLAVWAYFVVQSLFFTVAGARPRAARRSADGDRFELARVGIERLLEETGR